ncbi:hypothetical protein [Brachyspira aalborgi]|nr:hypothetical protein [Brachyspira aalborgi]
MSLTNKLLIIGFILLCIYTIISRIVNNKNKNENGKDDKKEDNINKD